MDVLGLVSQQAMQAYLCLHNYKSINISKSESLILAQLSPIYEALNSDELAINLFTSPLSSSDLDDHDTGNMLPRSTTPGQFLRSKRPDVLQFTELYSLFSRQMTLPRKDHHRVAVMTDYTKAFLLLIALSLP